MQEFSCGDATLLIIWSILSTKAKVKVCFILARLDPGGKRVAPPPVSYSKPLKGKLMFLDLKGLKGLATLESQLKVLGAVSVLSFFQRKC